MTHNSDRYPVDDNPPAPDEGRQIADLLPKTTKGLMNDMVDLELRVAFERLSPADQDRLRRLLAAAAIMLGILEEPFDDNESDYLG